jgi:protoheme IX farnesyltransferase
MAEERLNLPIRSMEMKPAALPQFLAWLNALLSIAKVPLSLWITLSAAAAYLIYQPAFDTKLLLTSLAVFLLACGCASLNNYQDRRIDQNLSRTCNRPLPARRIPSSYARVQAILLISAGEGLLFLVQSSIVLPLMGAFALLCYNYLYTPLKPVTSLAIIPGTVCGMLGPAIGWLAAGGSFLSLKLWSLMIIIGVWQPPHFWLVLLAHSNDYCRQTTFNMLKKFHRTQLHRLLFVWTAAFAALTLAPALTQVVTTFALQCLLALNALAIVCLFACLFFILPASPVYKKLFGYFNFSMFFVLALAITDRFLQLN